MLTPSGGNGVTISEAEEVDALLERTLRPKIRRWPLVVVGVILALIAGWALVAARSLGGDPTVVRSALIGKQAPEFALPALGGGQIDLASYRGEVLVVNFWASWCAPCREEAPELQAFAERWSGRDVSLLGIVYNDAESDAVDFRDRFGLTYPQALDSDGRTAIDFGVFGIPETYVIDRDGTVMAKLIGAVDATTLDEVVAAVEEGRSVTKRNDRYRTQPGGP